MASRHNTDCIYFDWKLVNYDRKFLMETYFNAGNRSYIPTCSQPETAWMFLRPIDSPCEGCPYYEAGEDKGINPPES